MELTEYAKSFILWQITIFNEWETLLAVLGHDSKCMADNEPFLLRTLKTYQKTSGYFEIQNIIHNDMGWKSGG